MDTLEWIENWYASHCDEDWEHDYGVRVQNCDNPGWIVEIDVMGTELENLTIEYKLVEGTETRVDVFGMTQSIDWYGFSMDGKQFKGAGDPTKLRVLLEAFRQIVREHTGSDSLSRQ